MNDEMFEPPAKIIRLDRPVYNNGEAMEFYVILCSDVIIDVFQYGNRRQLTKLERTGRRFHRIAECYFEKCPFLRLYLVISPPLWESEQELLVKIGRDIEKREAETTISYADLATFPPFLRFHDIVLIYMWSGTSNHQLCEWIQAYLQTLKPALRDLNLMYFAAKVDRYNNPCDFKSIPELIDHLSNKLLPLCSSSRSYEFSIAGPVNPTYNESEMDLRTDVNDTANLFASILQTSQIERCSNVTINIDRVYQSVRLPVVAISDWLNYTSNARGEERKLSVEMFEIQNLLEINDHLFEIFTKAKLPGQPFTLRLDSRFNDDEDDGWNHLDALNFEEVYSNKKTKEEFSIQKKPYFYCEFKRGAAQKRSGSKKERQC